MLRYGQLSLCHKTDPNCLKVSSWGRFCELFECEPSIGVELHFTDEEFGTSTELGIVGVGDEVPLAVGELIGGAVSDAIVAIVGADEKCAAAIGEVFSFTVEIGAHDGGTAAVSGFVGGVLASAAVIEAHKEVVPVAALENERSFDGVVTCLDSVLSFNGNRYLAEFTMAVDATSDGNGFSKTSLEVGIELLELNAIPERPPNKIVFAEVGIDSIPVVDVRM